MTVKDIEGQMKVGRTPQGVRGLKCERDVLRIVVDSRTPQGVRGLKFVDDLDGFPAIQVAPRKGCVD